MPTTKTKQAVAQGAMTIAEIDVLRAEIADLKLQNTELKTKCESLEKQIQDLTDPVKNAEAAAFKRAMRSR